jgi:hypothetical protein
MVNRPWMGTPGAALGLDLADVEVATVDTKADVVAAVDAAGAPEEPPPPSECSRVTRPRIAVMSVAIPVSTPGNVVQNVRKPPPRGGCLLPKDGSSFPIGSSRGHRTPGLQRVLAPVRQLSMSR